MQPTNEDKSLGFVNGANLNTTPKENRTDTAKTLIERYTVTESVIPYILPTHKTRARKPQIAPA